MGMFYCRRIKKIDDLDTHLRTGNDQGKTPKIKRTNY